MEHDNFKLCGGTLFALLTNAKLNKKKSTFQRKGYSEEELMLDLVRIYYPSVQFGDSFKKDTNNFKRCIIDDCSSFSFTNQELINSFDNELKANYPLKMQQMSELLKHFFDLKNEPVLNKLVRSILELIEKDDSINKNAKFYVLPNGSSITKLDMLLRDTFNLSSFILGVFHYVIVNKIDNRLGIQTYKTWYTSPGNNKKHDFTSNIGNNYKAINLVIAVENIEATNEEVAEETEQPSLDGIIYETNSNKSTNENKTINIYKPVYQNGRNNFNGIGSLTFIDKD